MCVCCLCRYGTALRARTPRRAASCGRRCTAPPHRATTQVGAGKEGREQWQAGRQAAAKHRHWRKMCNHLRAGWGQGKMHLALCCRMCSWLMRVRTAACLVSSAHCNDQASSTSLRNQPRTCAAVSSRRILSLLHRRQSPVLAPLRLPCSYAPPPPCTVQPSRWWCRRLSTPRAPLCAAPSRA